MTDNMTTAKKQLNLLVIDNNQAYAKHVRELLTPYYKEIHLDVLKDKGLFVNGLTGKKWDVAIYVQGYDMQLIDVIYIIKEQKVDLPVISLLSEETAKEGINEQGFASVINDSLLKAISADKDEHILLAIILYQQISEKLHTIRALSSRVNANSTEIAKKLALLQRTDRVTGLENRQGFMERLEKTRKIVKAKKQTAGLMYARLDNLDKINGSLGVQGLDTTIKQVANTLTQFFNKDYVSCFSDGIFTIIIENTNKEQLQQSAEDIRQAVDDILIEVGHRTADTTFSIGLVLIEENCPSVDAILARAVEAFNQVMINTNDKGNACHLYDPSQYIDNNDDALAEYLTRSLNENNFLLSYQPIYDIDTDTSARFEVYTGLKLSDGKKMLYSEFASVATENNLLGKIDRWILINACKQLSKVRQTYPEASIIVNLSSAMLIDKQLVRIIAHLIKALKGDASALTLQFDEKDIMDYLTVAQKQFSALAQLNCQVSMKSFGSTEKSMEVAEFVKPSIVRLDKSCMNDLSNANELETVKELINAINEHNIQVLMPYIEDASTLSVAWSIGARYLQGAYFQPPTTEMSFE